MGILLAIFFGLFFKQALNSRLARGGLSLPVTFWGFGIIGGGIILSICGWYVIYKYGSDTSNGLFWTLSAFKAVMIPMAIYSLCILLGIWRSSKQSGFLSKWGSRYISLFFLSFALLPIVYSWLNALVFAVVAFFVYKTSKRHSTKNIITEPN